jgi:hypothetical protein
VVFRLGELFRQQEHGAGSRDTTSPTSPRQDKALAPNRVLLENQFLACELDCQIDTFATHSDHSRCHERLANLTPVDTYQRSVSGPDTMAIIFYVDK